MGDPVLSCLPLPFLSLLPPPPCFFSFSLPVPPTFSPLPLPIHKIGFLRRPSPFIGCFCLLMPLSHPFADLIRSLTLAPFCPFQRMYQQHQEKDQRPREEDVKLLLAEAERFKRLAFWGVMVCTGQLRAERERVEGMDSGFGKRRTKVGQCAIIDPSPPLRCFSCHSDRVDVCADALLVHPVHPIFPP